MCWLGATPAARADSGLYAGFPSAKQLLTNIQQFLNFSLGGPPDPQVYTFLIRPFLIRRLALAIQRADDDLGPAPAGWSDQQLLGVAQNRSLEAHPANFGLGVAIRRRCWHRSSIPTSPTVPPRSTEAASSSGSATAPSRSPGPMAACSPSGSRPARPSASRPARARIGTATWPRTASAEPSTGTPPKG
jgi:hypothetical protein